MQRRPERKLSLSIIHQQRDVRIVDILGGIPFSAGIHIHDFLAHSGLGGQFHGQIADPVGVLGHGADEPALTHRVLLGSSGIKASHDQIAVAGSVGQFAAIGGGGQEA